MSFRIALLLVLDIKTTRYVYTYREAPFRAVHLEMTLSTAPFTVFYSTIYCFDRRQRIENHPISFLSCSAASQERMKKMKSKGIASTMNKTGKDV